MCAFCTNVAIINPYYWMRRARTVQSNVLYTFEHIHPLVHIILCMYNAYKYALQRLDCEFYASEWAT